MSLVWLLFSSFKFRAQNCSSCSTHLLKQMSATFEPNMSCSWKAYSFDSPWTATNDRRLIKPDLNIDWIRFCWLWLWLYYISIHLHMVHMFLYACTLTCMHACTCACMYELYANVRACMLVCFWMCYLCSCFGSCTDC